MDNTKVINDFLENGYFKYPIKENVQSKLGRIVDLWRQFRFQEMSLKRTHVFDDKRGGYEYKDPESLDFKENFHISLSYQLPKTATLIDKLFVEKSKEFILATFQNLSEMLEIFDEASQADMRDIVLDSIGHWQLRFLYDPPRSGIKTQNEFLAAPHIDKGITTHWYEDTGGLEILWNDQWSLVEGESGVVHGYFGMSGQLYSNSRFPALCHRVVANPHTIEFGRTSIVMFHDFGDYIYDKEQWGSTQEVFPKGENYKMPIEEFSKYFKKI
jgi:hypothetical protein